MRKQLIQRSVTKQFIETQGEDFALAQIREIGRIPVEATVRREGYRTLPDGGAVPTPDELADRFDYIFILGGEQK